MRFAVSSTLLLTAVALSAQAKAAAPPEQSCKAYVQKFYSWYVPELFRQKDTWASETALNRKEFSFSLELRKALKADFAASAANKEEIVGLDFDPFTASQDPAKKYVVGNVKVSDGHCVADIFGIDDGKRSKNYDLQAQLKEVSGSWQFTNFFYPPSGSVKRTDLLTILKQMADDRRRNP